MTAAKEYTKNELKEFIHQELQKARHDWLQEEIVKLEGMKNEMPKIIREPFELAESVGKKILLNRIIQRYHSELDQAPEQLPKAPELSEPPTRELLD
jgi:uncharacterized protein YydD (DUF2326 family)